MERISGLTKEQQDASADNTSVVDNAIGEHVFELHSLIAGAKAMIAQVEQGGPQVTTLDLTHAAGCLEIAMTKVDELEELVYELTRNLRDAGDQALVRAA